MTAKILQTIVTLSVELNPPPCPSFPKDAPPAAETVSVECIVIGRNVDTAVGLAYFCVSALIHMRQKSTLPNTTDASTSMTTTLRGHLLVLVATADDPDVVAVTVLYTITVGVLPGTAGKVVVPVAAAFVLG
jgi:hypothetical protein